MIYIAPLKALVRERMADWGRGLCAALGKRMVELTGGGGWEVGGRGLWGVLQGGGGGRVGQEDGGAHGWGGRGGGFGVRRGVGGPVGGYWVALVQEAGSCACLTA